MLVKHKGILLFTKIHKENDLLVKFLSNSDQIISGIVYGGLSKKKRNIYQIGFYLNFEVLQKNNKPSSINAELSEPYISNIINDKYKLNCLMCVTSLINISILEGQKIKNLYNISNEFLQTMFFKNKWYSHFCIFLFNLLKIIGYEIDFLSNKNLKYFDLIKLEFTETKSFNTIEFPFNMLDKNNLKIKLDHVIQIFKIFETIFVENHLSNLNLQLPNQYLLFKKLIIERIK
tara:strand:- start:254 stop:949 length:696 start_codon:yes stop_codon:yes gene_type:complete